VLNADHLRAQQATVEALPDSALRVSGSILGAKTIQSIRVVGNFGAAILSDPTTGHRQNDVVTYGVSLARAITGAAEVVAELNGRVSVRSGDIDAAQPAMDLLQPGPEHRTRCGSPPTLRITSDTLRAPH
jgi:hypothetical protein